jgi:hypothetical protein
MVLMADTPRILWTIMAFPFVCPYLSLSVHVLPLMCRQCPMVIWIITLLFVFSAMTPSTMYSPLMPLSRCFLHLIYLPIYVFFLTCQHLFEVTDLTTRGCSFFGDSNCPTLFICYAGSIEKLTLLGAIYYYYYYYYYYYSQGDTCS